jgi:hypothetical protein
MSVKVKCLIPSEFGVNTCEARGTKLGQTWGSRGYNCQTFGIVSCKFTIGEKEPVNNAPNAVLEFLRERILTRHDITENAIAITLDIICAKRQSPLRMIDVGITYGDGSRLLARYGQGTAINIVIKRPPKQPPPTYPLPFSTCYTNSQQIAKNVIPQ